MSTATVRIPEDKRDTLKIIASIEKREPKEIVSELIDDYVERHKETLELLSTPEAIKAEMNRAGYALVQGHAFLPKQYFLVFQREAVLSGFPTGDKVTL
jgi:hypothetical protein